MRRPFLIGEVNPHSILLNHALAPFPAGCTGHRLWKMLNSRVEVSRDVYMNTFDRRNLCFGEWNAEEAMKKANFLRTHISRGNTVILLGEKVRWAFGLPKVLIHPLLLDGVTYRQLPHPSGRNLFYNDPLCKELAARVLEEAYGSSSVRK